MEVQGGNETITVLSKGPFTLSNCESECKTFFKCVVSQDVNSSTEMTRTSVIFDVAFAFAIADAQCERPWVIITADNKNKYEKFVNTPKFEI